MGIVFYAGEEIRFSLGFLQAATGSSSSPVFKDEGQEGQMTSCECDSCLCKVGNGKVGITVFCVKRSDEQYITWARMKATMSREIKHFPVKASGPEYLSAGPVTGLRSEGRRCFRMHTQGPAQVNNVSFQLFTFREGIQRTLKC